jgi:hypothetical protein
MLISRSSLLLAGVLAASAFFACEDKSNTSTPAAASSSPSSVVSAALSASAAPNAMASASAAPSASASAVASALIASASAAPSGSASAAPSASALASAAPSGSASAAATCGKKPLPDCPLQGWMKANTSGAMSAQNFDALEKALNQIVNFAPPGYTNWASISKDGAKAAHDQNLDAVKASCRGCHNQYQKKYREEMRTRKI